MLKACFKELSKNTFQCFYFNKFVFHEPDTSVAHLVGFILYLASVWILKKLLFGYLKIPIFTDSSSLLLSLIT